MIINFYLNNEEETPITTCYDMQSNPFYLGDVIHLDVEELYPVEYNKYKEDYRGNVRNDNNELKKKFKQKSVKLVKEYKSVRFKVIKEAVLTIEYHCEFVD